MGDRDGDLAGILGVCAGLATLAVQLIAERARDDYDSASQLISELGERGAPNGAVVSWAGFVPVGLITIAFGVFAWRALRSDRRMAWGAGVVGVCVGLAYVVSAFARCEPGCPADGDVAQTIHNVAGGGLEYVGAVVGMALVGFGARRVAERRLEAVMSLVAAALVLVGSAFLERESLADSRGVIQRLLEIVIFGWVVVMGARLVRPTPAPSAT